MLCGGWAFGLALFYLTNLLNFFYLQYSMPTPREEFVEYAEAWYGKWYKWGGDDPSGFDCSGLAIECLKAFDKFPRGEDTTANGLLVRFAHLVVSDPKPGCLVFWVNPDGYAFHVEICKNSWQSIGASGGGSNTRTESDAIRDNAFIKLRPFKSRIGTKIFCDPFDETA